MKLKHIYNNQNLKNYCDDNNFNYSTILKKLNDLKKLDEYKDLTDNEIIKIIIEKKYKTKYKYFYNNQNLKTYCNDNNLSYKFVVGKINNLKKLDEYKDLDDNDIVTIVIEKKYKNKSSKYNYFYKNQPLEHYCKDNYLNYNYAKEKISKLKKLDEYKDLTDDDIVIIFIEKKYKTNKYNYNNQSLKNYCKENEFNYQKILNKIYYLKKLDEYKDLSIDKMIEIVLTEHYTTNSKKKYFYNNQYLKVYCIENKLNYKSILNKVKRLRKLDEYKDLNNDQIVEMVIEKKYITNAKYFYKNETLDIYCQKNNLNYNIITKTIKKIEQKEQYKNLELTELIELIINNFKPQSKNELINLKNNLEEINFENKIKKKI